MKKWSNPELKNLKVEETFSSECPLSGQTKDFGNCLNCILPNGVSYRCPVCGGCTNPGWIGGWLNAKQCTCKQS